MNVDGIRVCESAFSYFDVERKHLTLSDAVRVREHWQWNRISNVEVWWTFKVEQKGNC